MGGRLQKLREQKGLSQSQLARAAGVPVGSLRHWEHGRRTPLLDAAARLAVALECSIDDLAGIGAASEKPASKKSAKRKGG